VHLFDAKQGRIKFTLLYLFPQILAVLALLAVGAFWFFPMLLAVLFLAALAPLPSPSRTEIELRGYAMTLAVEYWTAGSIPEDSVSRYSEYFTGWSYYMMSPDRVYVMDRLNVIVEAIKSNKIFEGPQAEPYRDVFLLLKREGLVKAGELNV
jgi:hypothetical protein